MAPDDARLTKERDIPGEVFDVFNELIVESMSKSRNLTAQVGQSHVVMRITMKMGWKVRNDIHEKGWLEVEDAYRALGWSVEYVKAARDNDHEPYFVFRKEAKKP